MANLVPKVSRTAWVDTARLVLLEEGIQGVKVDRLAQRLGVTKGGFYKQFSDRAELLEDLLVLWEQGNRFLPPMPAALDAPTARALLDALADRLIDEVDFDPRFDMAVRSWGHIDPATNARVVQVDRQRMAELQRLFEGVGVPPVEADVRARIFYFHQIGYYALGLREARAERLRARPVFMRLLTGLDIESGA